MVPCFIPCILNLIKFCFQVTYNEVAKNETHRHCYEPLVRQCNGEPANNREVCKVWQYRLWNFQGRHTKLERFLVKNEHTQRKLLNFESWTNGEPQQLAKLRVFKVDYFILPLFLVSKLRLVAQNEWKKHPYIFFLFSIQK